VRLTALPLLALGILTSATACADRIPAYFIAENFMWASRAQNGVYHKLSWLYGEVSLRPDLKLVGSYLDFPQSSGPYRTLDEAFVEWQPAGYVVRAGRIRPRIGFGDWSELMYSPINSFPLARTQPMSANASVPGFSSGVDILGGPANVQVQLGLVELKPDDWQIAPRHLNVAVARVQVSVGEALVGINAMGKIRGNTDGSQIGGLDLLWAKEGWQVRGELFKGIGKGPTGQGAHLDVSYRPKGLHRTQLAVRADHYRNLAGDSVLLNTLGVRQILSKEFVATLNYSWGSKAAPAEKMRGWSLKFMTAIRF
jgi:hypothetical protein